jgi:hypothetical protein
MVQKNWSQAKIHCLEILGMHTHTLHTSNDAPEENTTYENN